MNCIWGAFESMYDLDCWNLSLKDHRDVHDRQDLLHKRC